MKEFERFDAFEKLKERQEAKKIVEFKENLRVGLFIASANKIPFIAVSHINFDEIINSCGEKKFSKEAVALYEKIFEKLYKCAENKDMSLETRIKASEEFLKWYKNLNAINTDESIEIKDASPLSKLLFDIATKEYEDNRYSVSDNLELLKNKYKFENDIKNLKSSIEKVSGIIEETIDIASFYFNNQLKIEGIERNIQLQEILNTTNRELDKNSEGLKIKCEEMAKAAVKETANVICGMIKVKLEEDELNVLYNNKNIMKQLEKFRQSDEVEFELIAQSIGELNDFIELSREHDKEAYHVEVKENFLIRILKFILGIDTIQQHAEKDRVNINKIISSDTKKILQEEDKLRVIHKLKDSIPAAMKNVKIHEHEKVSHLKVGEKKYTAKLEQARKNDNIGSRRL